MDGAGRTLIVSGASGCSWICSQSGNKLGATAVATYTRAHLHPHAKDVSCRPLSHGAPRCSAPHWWTTIAFQASDPIGSQ